MLACLLVLTHLVTPATAEPASPSQKKGTTTYPKECQLVLLNSAYSKEPKFKWRKGERYKHSPVVAYEINEAGEVLNPAIRRSSGVKDIDKWILESIRQRKYKPRPSGCGTVETKETVTIDWAASD